MALIGDADHIEMDDRSTVRASDDVDNTSEERLNGITSDDEYSRLHALRFVSLVEERPDETRVVDLLDVGRQSDGDVLVPGHGCLPT